MDAGGLGRALDLFLGRFRAAVGDVVADGADEQEDVLLDDADVPAQRIERHVADVHAVDRDAPARDVVEARDEVHDGGLAAAGGPSRAMTLPGFGIDVDAGEDGAQVVVAEGNVFEADVAFDVLERARVRASPARPIARPAVRRCARRRRCSGRRT